VDAGGKSLISLCFSKIAGAPIGSPRFLGSKEKSMACALRRYGVTDSGKTHIKMTRRLKVLCIGIIRKNGGPLFEKPSRSPPLRSSS
jgi:hypothetical protein